jgi:hypothetical protein
LTQFYFHLSTPDGFERDEFGCTFDTLEQAYLDTWTAALEISIEMLGRREDPSRFRFEITDGEGLLLLELPFTEVLRPHAIPRCAGFELKPRVAERLKRTRELQFEVNSGLAQVKASLRTARALLNRG